MLLGVLVRNLLRGLPLVLPVALGWFLNVSDPGKDWFTNPVVKALSLLRRSAVSTNRLRYHVSVCVSCCRVIVVCGAFRATHGLPSLRHRCTVGIDRDPPMCLDAQGGIKAKRQPFVV